MLYMMSERMLLERGIIAIMGTEEPLQRQVIPVTKKKKRSKALVSLT